MRRIFTILLSMTMVVMMSAAAFADSMTQESAVKAAFKDAGLSKDKVVGFEAEKDDGKYEIEFTDPDSGTEYSYEFSASSGKMLEKSVDYTYKRTSSKKKIGTKAARKKAAKISGIKYKTVKKGSCKYTYKKKFGKYKVKFKTGGYKYEVEIAAATGKIIELEKEATRK